MLPRAFVFCGYRLFLFGRKENRRTYRVRAHSQSAVKHVRKTALLRLNPQLPVVRARAVKHLEAHSRRIRRLRRAADTSVKSILNLPVIILWLFWHFLLHCYAFQLNVTDPHLNVIEDPSL